MILFIKYDHVVPTDYGANGSQVGLHSSREDQRSFFSNPISQFTFKLFVEFYGPIQKTRPSAGCSKTRNRIQRSLANFWMGSQSEIIIRPAHDKAMTSKNSFSAFVFRQRYKVRVIPTRDSFFGRSKF